MLSLFAYTFFGLCILLYCIVSIWATAEHQHLDRLERYDGVTDVRVLELVFRSDWSGGQQACVLDDWAVNIAKHITRERD